MIQCDSCNEWFHKSCKQIDDKYFDIPDISYYCSDKCSMQNCIVLCNCYAIILFVLYLLIVTSKDFKTNFLSIPCLINTKYSTPCHK